MCSSSIRRDLLFHLFGNNYTVLSLTKWTDFRSAYGKYRQTYQLNYPLIHHMGLYYIEFASFMYQNPSQEEHRFPHHVPLNWNVSSPRFPYVLNPSKVHWKAHILVESREISLISTYLLVNFTIFHHTCWSLISQRSIGWLRAPRKPRAPACRQMWAADSLERAQSWACQPWQWWLARLTIPPLQSRYKSISIGKIIFGTACFRFSGLPTRPKGGLGSWFSLVVP